MVHIIYNKAYIYTEYMKCSIHSFTNKNVYSKITNSSKIYKLLILINDHKLLKRDNIVSKLLTIMLF